VFKSLKTPQSFICYFDK